MERLAHEAFQDIKTIHKVVFLGNVTSDRNCIQVCLQFTNDLQIGKSICNIEKYSPYYTMHWGCVLVKFVSKNVRKTQEKRKRLAFLPNE